MLGEEEGELPVSYKRRVEIFGFDPRERYFVSP